MMLGHSPNQRTLGLGTLLGAVLLFGCSAEEPEQTPERAALITTVKASTGKVQVVEESIGRLASKRTPLLAAEIAAPVREVFVDVGDAVEADQVLAGLEQRDYRLALDRAKSEVTRLEALIRSQTRQVERLRDIIKQQFVNEAQLDEAEAQLEALQAQLMSARASRESAERDLARTRVRAPMDGRVAERHVSPGDFVQRGDPMFRITTTGTLQAVLPFPEGAAERLTVGLSVELQTPSAPGRIATGRITEISPGINPSSRNLEVIVELQNPGDWRPGATVRGRVILAERSDAVTVPELSLVRRPAGHVVYVIENGKALQRRVQTGVRQDGRVEIREGLQGGEVIAVEGAGFLSDEASVKISEDSEDTRA